MALGRHGAQPVAQGSGRPPACPGIALPVKAVITGASGQLGRALLAAADPDVEAKGFARAELDITDPASLKRGIEQFAPDVVINAAAYTAVARAESEEAQAFRVNTEAVAALSHPRNLVLRTAWLYGNHGQNFVKTMLRLMREKETLGVVADQIGTPTHARSLAQAIWALVGHDAHGVLHFTDAGTASWYDFAVAIQEESVRIGLLQREIPILPIATADYPTPATRPAYSVLDKSDCWAV